MKANKLIRGFAALMMCIVVLTSSTMPVLASGVAKDGTGDTSNNGNEQIVDPYESQKQELDALRNEWAENKNNPSISDTDKAHLNMLVEIVYNQIASTVPGYNVPISKNWDRQSGQPYREYLRGKEMKTRAEVGWTITVMESMPVSQNIGPAESLKAAWNGFNDGLGGIISYQEATFCYCPSGSATAYTDDADTGTEIRYVSSDIFEQIMAAAYAAETGQGDAGYAFYAKMKELGILNQAGFDHALAEFNTVLNGGTSTLLELVVMPYIIDIRGDFYPWKGTTGNHPVLFDSKDAYEAEFEAFAEPHFKDATVDFKETFMGTASNLDVTGTFAIKAVAPSPGTTTVFGGTRYTAYRVAIPYVDDDDDITEYPNSSIEVKGRPQPGTNDWDENPEVVGTWIITPKIGGDITSLIEDDLVVFEGKLEPAGGELTIGDMIDFNVDGGFAKLTSPSGKDPGVYVNTGSGDYKVKLDMSMVSTWNSKGSFTVMYKVTDGSNNAGLQKCNLKGTIETAGHKEAEDWAGWIGNIIPPNPPEDWGYHFSTGDPTLMGEPYANALDDQDWDLGVGIPSTENISLKTDATIGVSDALGMVCARVAPNKGVGSGVEANKSNMDEDQQGVANSAAPAVTRTVKFISQIEHCWGQGNVQDELYLLYSLKVRLS